MPRKRTRPCSASPPAGHQHALHGERRERRLVDQPTTDRRLTCACSAIAPVASLRSHASKKPLSTIESASIITIASHSSNQRVLQCSLARRRSSRWFTGLTPQDGRAGQAGDDARAVRAAIVDDEELVRAVASRR